MLSSLHGPLVSTCQSLLSKIPRSCTHEEGAESVDPEPLSKWMWTLALEICPEHFSPTTLPLKPGLIRVETWEINNWNRFVMQHRLSCPYVQGWARMFPDRSPEWWRVEGRELPAPYTSVAAAHAQMGESVSMDTHPTFPLVTNLQWEAEAGTHNPKPVTSGCCPPWGGWCCRSALPAGMAWRFHHQDHRASLKDVVKLILWVLMQSLEHPSFT